MSDDLNIGFNAEEAYDSALQRIAVCRLDGDTYLDLSELGLTTLPPEVGELRQLKQLDISDNYLVGLPSEIGNLVDLTMLDVADNRLVELPSEIGDLASLRNLNLYGNRLSFLPAAIMRLVKLKELIVSNNQILAVPPQIGKLSKLSELYLGDNKFTSLPPEVGDLSALKLLSVQYASLTTLPDSLQRCTKLQRISLQGNELDHLPDWLQTLPRLTHLIVRRNESLRLPPEIAGVDGDEWGRPNAKKVLDYYFSRQEQGQRSLNEVKLLLVGRGESGKTSVSRALRGEIFDKEQKETPGIEIKAWDLECRANDQIKVHVWDFAGQEITHETHRFFLTERSLYVVVLDGRGGQQMEEAEYWLSHVEKFGTRRDRMKVERSPVIVVLNKWQSPGPYDVEQRRLQREYPNIKAFVQTDCATTFGISTLREAICAVLDQMPAVRQKWPTSYFNVRQKLLDLVEHSDPGQRRHFLKWEDYRTICAKCGVSDQNRQHSMAENLNALGVALYYGDDERLRDTRVLNPNWAANGLYGLVRGVQRLPYQEKRGHLWSGEFASVLAEGMKGMDPVRGAVIDDYPQERDGVKVHEFLLDLMVDRELGFQTGTVMGKPLYLLPGLLTLDEPEVEDYDVASHMEQAQVRFRYLYELLPAGVMSRFIVRTHSMSEGLYRWQRGVVLAWGDARGLVMAERRRNPRLDVYIFGGTAEERQELAGVIRANMEVIHRDLPEGLQGIEELDLSVPGEQYERVTKLERLEEANQPVQIVGPSGPQQIPVTPQLEQVQPAKARRKGTPKLRVFVSYSHANYRLWDRLRTHLDILKNERLVSWWFDGRIRPGSEWDDAIRNELKEADIIVMLLSNEFFASRYIKGVEMREARRRHRSGEAGILPVLLEPSPAFGKQAWLKTLQTVPVVKGQLRPLSGFNPAVTGWNEVQTALRGMIADIAERRRLG